MDTITVIALLLAGGVIGVLGAYYLLSQKQKSLAGKMISAAQKEADEILARAEETTNTLKREIDEARNDIKERKNTLIDQEKRLEDKEHRIDKKYEELEVKNQELLTKDQSLEEIRRDLESRRDVAAKKLEELAKFSESEAKAQLLSITEEKYEKDILDLIEKKKKEINTRQEDMAREILIKAIQQYAGDVTGETTQTMVTLESDDLKGKIIGKEGRNIIAFEKATGVSLIIDDAPDTVFLSSFDLFRRYIAKKSLEDLIADKRIQPARIEEIVEKNQADAEKLIYDLGQKTVDEMGIVGIPDEILPLIGKFRFRTSYGQNILMHSKEVAYIAEAIAKLIGADPVLALKGGLLHDLGKAMDHDIEGTHPEIGGRIARKYGLDDKTVNIIE